MTDRKIKFRAWDGNLRVMEDDVHVLDRFAEILSRDHYTVLQYTGLKDKNGKEIYDGDILNWDYSGETEGRDWMKDPVYKVTYEDDYFVCGVGLKQDLFLHPFRFKHTEAVGNIYANPELL